MSEFFLSSLFVLPPQLEVVFRFPSFLFSVLFIFFVFCLFIFLLLRYPAALGLSWLVAYPSPPTSLFFSLCLLDRSLPVIPFNLPATLLFPFRIFFFFLHPSLFVLWHPDLISNQETTPKTLLLISYPLLPNPRPDNRVNAVYFAAIYLDKINTILQRH